jgi:putative transposase
LAERGIDISHESVRFWWNRFGPMFAAEIRKRRVAHMRGYPRWRWHLDEVFVKVNGRVCYLWRAVDHEGEVLEAVVTSKRDKAAALKLLKRIMKKYGAPRSIVTDGLRAYSAADERDRCLPSSTRSAVGSTIAQRIRISRFGDANGRCSAFEVRRRCRSSARFMPRCTTNSIRSAISSRGKSTSRDALLPWLSGALSRHRSPLARWRSRCTSTSVRYFDTTPQDEAVSPPGPTSRR